MDIEESKVKSITLRHALVYTGIFYCIWSALEVFVMMQAVSAYRQEDASASLAPFFIQTGGFFLMLMCGMCAYMSKRAHSMTKWAVVFAAAHAAFTLIYFICASAVSGGVDASGLVGSLVYVAIDAAIIVLGASLIKRKQEIDRAKGQKAR